jgi:hypothetical protein
MRAMAREAITLKSLPPKAPLLRCVWDKNTPGIPAPMLQRQAKSVDSELTKQVLQENELHLKLLDHFVSVFRERTTLFFHLPPASKGVLQPLNG